MEKYITRLPRSYRAHPLLVRFSLSYRCLQLSINQSINLFVQQKLQRIQYKQLLSSRSPQPLSGKSGKVFLLLNLWSIK